MADLFEALYRKPLVRQKVKKAAVYVPDLFHRFAIDRHATTTESVDMFDRLRDAVYVREISRQEARDLIPVDDSREGLTIIQNEETNESTSV